MIADSGCGAAATMPARSPSRSPVISETTVSGFIQAGGSALDPGTRLRRIERSGDIPYRDGSERGEVAGRERPG